MIQMTTKDYLKEFARLGKIVQISHTDYGIGKNLRMVQRRHEHGFSETLFIKRDGRWKSLEDKLWFVSDTETSSLTT